MNNNFKSGFVTIVGRPNVGKSTLMNRIVGEKIAIMSNKPQTTRNRIQSIYTTDEGQIVFIDTPGIHKPKSKLGEFMVKTAESTMNGVDLVLFLIEPTEEAGQGDRYIMEQLKHIKSPKILVINKIDSVPRETLLKVMNTYKDLCDFDEIIPISAYTGENVDSLMKNLFTYMEEGPMYFPSDMITDQPERQLVAEFIREKALHSLQQEIPHGIAVVIDVMKERKGNKNMMDITATIVCERESHKRIIIGKQGSMLKKIGSLARKDMETMLGTKVYLQLWVKIKKDWRDSDFLLNNFGYNNQDY